MKKYKAIILVGPSGSGKDRLATEICHNDPDTYYFVVSATTRPKRDYEVENESYIFLTKEEFKKAEKIEESCFNGWYYGMLLSSLNEDKINMLVLNPQGIKTLLTNKDINIDILSIIQLEVTDKERLIRQLDRERNPNVDEIIRRYSTDKKDFEEFAEWCKNTNTKITKLPNEDAMDFTMNCNYILGVSS